jgi:hypothetical protein
MQCLTLPFQPKTAAPEARESLATLELMAWRSQAGLAALAYAM